MIQLNDNEFWKQLINNKQISVIGLTIDMPSYRRKQQYIIPMADEQTYRKLV